MIIGVEIDVDRKFDTAAITRQWIENWLRAGKQLDKVGFADRVLQPSAVVTVSVTV